MKAGRKTRCGYRVADDNRGIGGFYCQRLRRGYTGVFVKEIVRGGYFGYGGLYDRTIGNIKAAAFQNAPPAAAVSFTRIHKV